MFHPTLCYFEVYKIIFISFQIFVIFLAALCYGAMFRSFARSAARVISGGVGAQVRLHWASKHGSSGAAASRPGGRPGPHGACAPLDGGVLISEVVNTN